MRARLQRSTIQRNQEIARRRKSGETYRSIASDFGISTERVKQICDRQDWEARRRDQYPKLQILDIPFQIYGALTRHAKLEDDPRFGDPDALAAMTDDELGKVRQLGPVGIGILRSALAGV